MNMIKFPPRLREFLIHQLHLRRLKRGIRRAISPPLHKPKIEIKYRIFGNDYGGFPIPEGILETQSIVYSVGVGADLSFDHEVISEYGCNVYAFDPTPRSLKWIATQTLPKELTFRPVGLSEDSGFLHFYAPKNSEHVSYTEHGEGRGTECIRCPVRTLADLMAEEGHSEIDVLKMDIEGSEYGVIRSIAQEKIRPKVILVEFHHWMDEFRNDDTLNAVAALEDMGYQCFYVSYLGHEYGFVLRPEKYVET